MSGLAKLYYYFGTIGIASIVLWAIALLLFAWAWRRERRHRIFYVAFAIAAAGLVCTKINSAKVSAIRTDFSDQKAAAHRQYASERGAANVRFAEDSGHDQLDMAGMKRDERLAVDAEVDPGVAVANATADDYRTRGKVERESGKKKPIITEDGEKLESRDDEEVNVRKMKPEDVLRANRYDRYNLFFTKLVFWVILISIFWDYFKNFNSTTGTYFPLPLSSRALDALFPKAHSVIVEKPETEAMAHYLETAVRKGESIIYFGPADPWPEDWALPRLLLGKRPLLPFAKISPGEAALPRTPHFFWDSAWFGRYAVLVTNPGECMTMLDNLLDYLRLRLRTQAAARRTVNFVWHAGVLPDHLLKELIKLASEANLKFVYAAPALPARSVVKSFGEAYCDEASIAALQPEAEAKSGVPAPVLKPVRHPYAKYAYAVVGILLAAGLGTWAVMRQMPEKLPVVTPAPTPSTKPGTGGDKPGTTPATPGKPGQVATMTGAGKPGDKPEATPAAPGTGTTPVANPGTTPEAVPTAPTEDPNDPLVQAVAEVRSLRDAGEFKQALDKLVQLNEKFPGNAKLDELRNIEGRLKEALRDAPQLQIALDKLASPDDTIVQVASGQLMETGEIGSILMRKTVRDSSNEAAAGAAATVLSKQVDGKAVPAIVARLKTASPDLNLKLVKALLPLTDHIKGEPLKALCLLIQDDPQFKNRLIVRLLGNVIKKTFYGEAVEFDKSCGLPGAAEKLLWYADDAASSKEKDLAKWGKETYESLKKVVLVPGLAGTYYNNESLDPVGYAFERVDPSPNFDDEKAFNLPKGRKSHFSVRWTGVIKVKTPGNYLFTLKADDGARLWVAERSLLDRWGRAMNMEVNIEIAKPGYFAIVLEYQQIDQAGAVNLLWEGPDFKKRLIAVEDLRCTPVRPKDSKTTATLPTK